MKKNVLEVSRRTAMAWLGASSCASVLAPLPALAAVPTDTLTVLYRRDTHNAPARLDPAAQAATLALEGEFANRGFRVIQPSAQTYQLLDQGPNMVISFAPDAGFSMVFSAFKSQRPMPGMDKIITEVILRCRVFVGHSILVAEEAKGMMPASAEADVREFAERRSAEQAAQRAAAALADKVARKLKALSAADLERLSSIAVAPGPTGQMTEPQASAAPVGSPPAPAAAPAALPPVNRKFALVITMSDYSPLRKRGVQITDLKGVELDRRNLLAGLPALGFEKENIVDLSNTEASSNSARDHLAKLVAKTKENDLVLIAISAHGAPAEFTPSGFGMPVLSDFDEKSRGGLDFWQLQSLVRNMPALRTVLVVDTCHSGGAAGMMTNAVVSAQGVSVQTGPVTPEPARLVQAQSQSGRAFAVLAASRPEQLSLEDSKGGIFIQALLRGLQAAKGQLSLEQVFKEHIEQQVIRASGPICADLRSCKVQNPVFAASGQGSQIRL